MQTTPDRAAAAGILTDANAMASFAVKDADAARRFYRDTLGLDVRDGQQPGLLEIHGQGGAPILVYPKPDHEPAVFTVLNLQVPDVEAAVDALTRAGVSFEHYDGPGGISTDAKGIAGGGDQGGPRIAWFRDPSGNIMSVLQGR
jgi:catechol 2,3-dioxygenase-like lactoylglutathione lyase family enzyme